MSIPPDPAERRTAQLETLAALCRQLPSPFLMPNDKEYLLTRAKSFAVNVGLQNDPEALAILKLASSFAPEASGPTLPTQQEPATMSPTKQPPTLTIILQSPNGQYDSLHLTPGPDPDWVRLEIDNHYSQVSITQLQFALQTILEYAPSEPTDIPF